MKLQGISVIFALIVLPLILVLSYYIQLQVDTIQKQNEYDKRLLDSTYDAMSAFEINTANEDLSSVSDSLRTIIEASTNVFITTLATNFGMSNASKSYLEPYVPAILYTLYDGYYISSPTRTPNVLTDSSGNAVSVGDVGVTVSGSSYVFNEVHTSQESENNCVECAAGTSGHVKYTDYFNNDNKGSYYVKKSELLEDTDYGQLLYLKDGTTNTYTTNIEEADFDIEHMLKSYISYSARYVNTTPGADFDITVVYTLDNYITIEGKVGEAYYTKSGYLIPEDIISITSGTDILGYNQEDAKKYIEAGNDITIEIKDGDVTTGVSNTTISSGGGRSYAEIEEDITRLNSAYKTTKSYYAQVESADTAGAQAMIDWCAAQGFIVSGSNDEEIKASIYENLENVMANITLDINNLQYELDKMSAVSYYVTAQIFSNWVYDNLSIVKENDIVEISGQEYKSVNGQEQIIYKFDSDNSVFNVVNPNTSLEKNSVTEVDKDSIFYTHKLNVIRNSIQYNLNIAMSTYNDKTVAAEDYGMPVMSNDEWEKILNNVSIVSFMQGYSCGLKTYNNYMIVSSTNNEVSVTLDDIYYIEKSAFNDEVTEYHRIDCPKLLDIDTGTTNEYISFKSKEVKYDKIYDKTNTAVPYEYDHRNYACYYCVNDGNYEKTKIFENSTYGNLRKTYYIGVGKARNNLYKMNGVEESQGYEVIYDSESSISKSSSLPLADIKKIEIVLATVRSHDSDENTLNYKVYVGSIADGNKLSGDAIYSVIPNSAKDTTLIVEVDQNISSSTKISINNLVFQNQFSESEAYSPGNTDADGDGVNDDKYLDKTFDERSTLIVRDSIKYIRVIYR